MVFARNVFFADKLEFVRGVGVSFAVNCFGGVLNPSTIASFRWLTLREHLGFVSAKNSRGFP